MQRLTAQCQTMENITIDNELFEVLALLNWLSKQKFYCRAERNWTHILDKACYAWKLRGESTQRVQ